MRYRFPILIFLFAAISLYAIAFLSVNPGQSTKLINTDQLIYPHTDFEYLGAFRLPNEESNGTSWSYGGDGMTYYPNGDPGGEVDGFPGSLYGVSHPYQRLISEFSIPAPVISPEKDVNDLPVAITLQPFYDITEGRQVNYLELTDLAYLPKQGDQTTDKLHWVMYEYYMPIEDKTTFGWSELDLSNPQSQGTWRLSDYPFAATSRYLFDVPSSWADIYTPGKYLAAGRYRTQGNGSRGPALYVYGPWNHGNPPPPGSTLEAIQLLYYTPDHPVMNYGNCDEWSDGAWITVGDRSAVMLVGSRPIRNTVNGLQYYGAPGPHGMGSKGYHGEPYYKALTFYDPADFIAVINGTMESYEPQPYATFNVSKYMFKPGERTTLGGVGFDRERGILYVFEKSIDGYYARKPIVHVWKISDRGGAFDTIAPTPPENLHMTQATSNHVTIIWEASRDNDEISGYIIYRNGLPIGLTSELSYTDEKVSPFNSYLYSVKAFDRMNNYGPECQPIEVLTPEGEDTMPPALIGIDVLDNTPSSATLFWMTDEPASCSVDLSILYGDPVGFFEDPEMKTVHFSDLNKLSQRTQYLYVITCKDRSGNEAQSTRKVFWTADSPKSDNHAPILKAPESFELRRGETVEFFLSATDPDRNRIFFNIDGLPEGAIFNKENGWFGWTPRHDQLGTFTIFFKASDGTLTESVSVEIISNAEFNSPLEDVNGDGLVDSRDIQACVNHILGIQDWGPAADVNGNMRVDWDDVENIKDEILR